MRQLELFDGLTATPQAQLPSLTLRTYCKRCRRTPQALCEDCRTRTVTFANTHACLSSHVLRDSHADGVTLCLVDADGAGYVFTSGVAGVREHMGLLQLAGVGQEA